MTTRFQACAFGPGSPRNRPAIGVGMPKIDETLKRCNSSGKRPIDPKLGDTCSGWIAALTHQVRYVFGKFDFGNFETL